MNKSNAIQHSRLMLAIWAAIVLGKTQDTWSQGLIPTPTEEYKRIARFQPTGAIELVKIEVEVDGKKVTKDKVVQGPLPNLPPAVDLTEYAPRPKAQSFGDCGAWAVAYCSLSTQYALARNRKQPSTLVDIFSPRFVYSQIGLGAFTGSYIYLEGPNSSSAVGLLKSVGCASEVTTPYIYLSTDPNGWSRKPDPRGIKEAANYRIEAHARCESIDDIRYSLVFGIPVVIGCWCPKDFTTFGGRATTNGRASNCWTTNRVATRCALLDTTM